MTNEEGRAEGRRATVWGATDRRPIIVGWVDTCMRGRCSMSRRTFNFSMKHEWGFGSGPDRTGTYGYGTPSMWQEHMTDGQLIARLTEESVCPYRHVSPANEGQLLYVIVYYSTACANRVSSRQALGRQTAGSSFTVVWIYATPAQSVPRFLNCFNWLKHFNSAFIGVVDYCNVDECMNACRLQGYTGTHI